MEINEIIERLSLVLKTVEQIEKNSSFLKEMSFQIEDSEAAEVIKKLLTIRDQTTCIVSQVSAIRNQVIEERIAIEQKFSKPFSVSIEEGLFLSFYFLNNFFKNFRMVLGELR